MFIVQCSSVVSHTKSDLSVQCQAKCGCGAGGGVPAKHVVLMSVYTGHNLHSQNPYPAIYLFFY